MNINPHEFKCHDDKKDKMVLTKVLLLFLVRINAMKILRIATQNKYCIALFATQNKFLKSNAANNKYYSATGHKLPEL